MSWTIKTHDWAVGMLRNHIERKMVRHAYLFTGPPGIGRRTLALQFAQALNCKQPPEPGVPCGVCRTCSQIGRLQQPDLAVILPEPDSLSIKVEQIRELQYTLNLSPYESRYRIAILDDFQAATTGAQNAFLKTLEEAPPKVILLLTADLAENLLPTIVSRCEVFRLRPARPQVIQEMLQADYSLAEEEARRIAHLSGGRAGTAIRLAQDGAALAEISQTMDETFQLLEMSLRDRFRYVEKWKPKKRDREESVALRKLARDTLQCWLLMWRDVFLLQQHAGVPLTYLGWQEQTARLAGKISPETAQAQMAAVEQALHRLESTNVNTMLLLEALLLDWPRV